MGDGWFRLENVSAERVHEVGAGAFAVFAAIARHADANGRAFPSAATIGKYTGMTKRTIWRAIKALESAKWISVKRTSDGGKLRNYYTLLPLLNGDIKAPSDKIAPSDKNIPSIVTKKHHEEDLYKKTNSVCKKRFVKPSIEEVQAYCLERTNSVDPQRWFDYYTSNGWMVGRNSMKDWKAAVRTWEKNGFSNGEVKKAEPLKYRG